MRSGIWALLLMAGAASPVVCAQPAVTAGAVVLLANSTDPAASDTLRRALSDPDRDVRRAAARVAWADAPRIEARLTALVKLAIECHPGAFVPRV